MNRSPHIETVRRVATSIRPALSVTARLAAVTVVLTSVAAMPVAAQSATTSDDVDICSSSKFPGIVNAVIQLAIYGGVVLGAVMYLGAEAMESRSFMSDQQLQSMKRAKRSGLRKILKLSVVPALLALLLKSAPLAWASCIDLTPF